ncbi:MAG TPA: hypothetical protein VGW37_02370 [Terriglobia bacterium]|nr:hypothetical protein [Terriglobia bacterium]
MYFGIIAVIIVIVVLWLGQSWRAERESMTDMDIATIVHHYLHGGGKYSEWGDFVENRFRNSRIERLRKVCWEAESKPQRERVAFLTDLEEKLRAGRFS